MNSERAVFMMVLIIWIGAAIGLADLAHQLLALIRRLLAGG